MEEFDYVIVGAGAAGCVLANRLTESAKNTVALLEAGGKDSNIWIKVPAGFNKTVYNDKLNWGYETAPGPYIDNRRIKFPRGKVLGGSGSINGHLYVRGQATDYDMWAQLGCRGWSWSDVLPYFKRAETRTGGDDAVRGRSGPLRIEDQSEPHLLSDAFMAANETLGLKRTPDYNGGDQEGTLLYQQMMHGGRRWSPVDAYLRPIMGRANLQLITHALAERVDLEGKRATGVTYRHNGRTVPIKARRDVILAAPSTRRNSCRFPASAIQPGWPTSAWQPGTHCPASAATCVTITPCASRPWSRAAARSTNAATGCGWWANCCAICSRARDCWRRARVMPAAISRRGPNWRHPICSSISRRRAMAAPAMARPRSTACQA